MEREPDRKIVITEEQMRELKLNLLYRVRNSLFEDNKIMKILGEMCIAAKIARSCEEVFARILELEHNN